MKSCKITYSRVWFLSLSLMYLRFIHIAVSVSCFKMLSSIPMYRQTTIDLPLHLLMDIWVVSSFRLPWMQLLSTVMFKSLCRLNILHFSWANFLNHFHGSFSPIELSAVLVIPPRNGSNYLSCSSSHLDSPFSHAWLPSDLCGASVVSGLHRGSLRFLHWDSLPTSLRFSPAIWVSSQMPPFHKLSLTLPLEGISPFTELGTLCTVLALRRNYSWFSFL